MSIISLLAKAIPSRKPAKPQALDKVCITIKLGYSSKDDMKDFWREKLMYASSTTTKPSKLFRIIPTSFLSNELPVGLLGLHNQIIFVFSSINCSMWAKFN